MTAHDTVPYDNDIAPAAALIADPTRAAILGALVPDRPLAAGELARLAGVSAATASFHLAKLLDGGLIAVARQGRHRYYRLAGHQVAAALEALGPISPAAAGAHPAAVPRGRRPRRGPHLLRPPGRPGRGRAAGRDARPGPAGKRPIFRPNGPWRERQHPLRSYRGRSGNAGFVRPRSHRSPPVTRLFAGECIDWTQRRGHLNGALGAAITARLFELGWIARGARRRSVLVTAAGAPGLADTFGLDLG